MKPFSSDPLISVILPAFNAERYLEASIQSILQQSYTNFELIVINDGSTDGSFALIKQLAAADARIKVVDNGRNLGLIATLNKGLSLAQGELIARHDGDDVAHPERFRQQVDFLQRHADIGLLGSAMELTDENSKPGEIYRQPETDSLIRFRLLFNNALIHSSVIFRSYLIKEHSLSYDPRFKLVEDYEMWTRFLSVTRAHNLQMPLVKYRVYSDSVSQKNNIEQSHRANDVANAQVRLLDPALDISFQDKQIMLETFMRFLRRERGSLTPEERRVLPGLRSLAKLAVDRFPSPDSNLRAFAAWIDSQSAASEPAAVRLMTERPDLMIPPTARVVKGMSYAPLDLTAMPAVSVITPFFNTGDIFLETAKSVLQQSLQQFEWIIINDGSTDESSLKLLNQFRDRDPRIRVIDHPQNRGLPAARNTGFAAARSELIFQLDSDDLIEAGTLEKCAWFLSSCPYASLVKGYTVGFGAKIYLWERGFEQTGEFLQSNPITATAMVRKCAHTAAGGYDETATGGFEDWDFWLRCARTRHWGATIPEYLDWYRTRESHADRWPAFKKQEREDRQRALLAKHSELKKTGFPRIDLWQEKSVGTFNEQIPFANSLQKQTKRLLFLIPWFAVGGAEKFNLDLLQLLVEQHDYEVTICATVETDLTWLPRFQQFTSDIFILPHFLSAADQPRFLSYLITSRQVDACLLTCSAVGYQLLPYLRSLYPDLPILDFLHIEQEAWRDGNYPRFSVNLGFCLDLTVVSSTYLKNWMVERGADADRVAVCYTNVDTKLLRPSTAQRTSIRKSLEIDESAPVILFAGRLSQQKRPKILAQAILALEKTGADFICLVAGDGPDEQWLKSFIRTNKLGKIRLLGGKTPEEVAALMAASDLLFLPSDNEGVSLVCYEAMAMGLPIVCSDVGGQSELITPECGILVKKQDGEINEYLKALKTLISDAGYRQQMKAAARCRVERDFPIEEMGKQISAFIVKASELRKQQPRAPVSADLGRAYCIEVLEQNRLARENQWHCEGRSRLSSRQFADIEFQIFVQCNGRFSEDNSVGGSYSSGQSTLISLPLPTWAGRRVRIDPSNAAGVIHIEEVALRDESNGDIVWSASMPSDFSGLKVKGTAQQMRNKNHLLIFSWGLDPQIFISVKRSKRPLVLELKMKHHKHMSGLDASVFDGSPRAADAAVPREIAVELPTDAAADSSKESFFRRIAKNFRR